MSWSITLCMTLIQWFTVLFFCQKNASTNPRWIYPRFLQILNRYGKSCTVIDNSAYFKLVKRQPLKKYLLVNKKLQAAAKLMKNPQMPDDLDYPRWKISMLHGFIWQAMMTILLASSVIVYYHGLWRKIRQHVDNKSYRSVLIMSSHNYQIWNCDPLNECGLSNFF